MDLGLQGARALVTGASRGIGRATARALAAEGCSVAVCARGQDGVDAVLAELRAAGATAVGQAVDVADTDALAAWVDAAADQLGGLDVVISNVSAGTVKGPDQWSTSFSVDLLPLVRLVEAALPHLRQSDHAAVVAISTTSALQISPPSGPTSYGAIKAAVIQHASALGHSLAAEGIRVNTVSPGPIEFPGGGWERNRSERPDFYAAVKQQIPTGRLGTAQEVANAVAFLASPAASFCTAVNLVVDGGFTSRVQY